MSDFVGKTLGWPNGWICLQNLNKNLAKELLVLDCDGIFSCE